MRSYYAHTYAHFYIEYKSLAKFLKNCLLSFETMSSVDGFDTIPDILPCPVCLDLPILKKVFQCRHGHLLCEDCYASIKICPQCRVPFDSEPIRSLGVEMLLDQLPFPINCIYETPGPGCKMKMNNLKSFRDHIKCCRFGPSICVCKNLGFACNFKVNGGTTAEEAIGHFEMAHGAVTIDSDSVQVEFSHYAKFSGGTKLFILNQKEKGYACLIHVKHVWQLNWTPLYLRYPMLGHPSGVDSYLSVITSSSSLQTQPKPSSIFYDSQDIWNILNYSDSPVANLHYQQSMSNKLLELWKGTSDSLFVSVEVREVGNAYAVWDLSQYVPHIVITPTEIKRNGAPALDVGWSILKASTNDCLEVLPWPIAGTSASFYSNISLGSGESTVSLKLDRIPDVLLCPVCKDLPTSSVFQCRKGHILCKDCNAQRENCPQCGILFDTPPIRFLAMEMLLDELTFELNCRYEMFGCNLRMSKLKGFGDHIKCCKYRFGRPINVCKGLGFETCSLQMNPGTTVEEAIQHFEMAHGATTRDSDTVQVEFADYVKFSGGTKLIILNQKVNGYACLILARHVSNSPQQLNWNPFYLRYPTLGESTDFDLKQTYLLTSNKSKVRFEYSQPVLDILKSPNQSSLLNLYEMLNIDALGMESSKGSTRSIFVSAGVRRRTGTPTKDCKRIPLITITSTQMAKNAGSNLGRNISGDRTQNPLEEMPQLTAANCSASCAVSNHTADTNKGDLRSRDGKNKKRSPNSKQGSGCTIV